MHEPNTDATEQSTDNPRAEARADASQRADVRRREASVRTTVWLGTTCALLGIAASAFGAGLGHASVLTGFVLLLWGVHKLGRLGPEPGFSFATGPDAATENEPAGAHQPAGASGPAGAAASETPDPSSTQAAGSDPE